MARADFPESLPVELWPESLKRLQAETSSPQTLVLFGLTRAARANIRRLLKLIYLAVHISAAKAVILAGTKENPISEVAYNKQSAFLAIKRALNTRSDQMLADIGNEIATFEQFNELNLGKLENSFGRDVPESFYLAAKLSSVMPRLASLLVDILFEQGIEVDTVNSGGITALEIALTRDDLQAACYLQGLGASYRNLSGDNCRKLITYKNEASPEEEEVSSDARIAASQ